jgi:integrase
MPIPLGEEAIRILKARKLSCAQLAQPDRGSPTRSEWVFPSAESKTGHIVNPEKSWMRILKSAGVKEKASLHDIRRTLGSNLAMNNVAGATITQVLGHVSPNSLRAYIHLNVTTGKEAIDQVFAPIIDRDKSLSQKSLRKE